MNPCQPESPLIDPHKELAEILRLVDEAAAEGVVITDSRGGLIYANATFLATTGLSSAELTNICLAATEEITSPSERVVGFLRQDGSEFNDRLTITPVFDSAHTIRFFVVKSQKNAQQLRGDLSDIAAFSSDDAEIDDGRRLLSELPQAIARDEMVLHYQPQANLLSGDIVGLEALIRWQHPELGLLFPGRFIALAEQSPHIVSLGNWVIRAACRQLRAWRDAGTPLVKVAINLSTQHFLEENLPATLRNALDEYGIEARFLEVEITEGAMMQDFALATRSIHELKEIGIAISLDDFGTGYSSMSYLSRFPIDVVKIDQSFVRDITTNPVNATIAQTTIAMSHQLGKTVLAEGVETEEQMHYLRRSECDEMQGYFFSKPLPADQVATLLREDRRLELKESADSTERGTVLIVDDEAYILTALKRALRKQGYELLTANSAAEGFALLAKQTIHVVLTDHQMPEMSGIEFLARVKALHPRTVRMILTGRSDVSTVTDAINKGAAYRFMLKPWQDDTLKSEISAALRYWKELYDREPSTRTD